MKYILILLLSCFSIIGYSHDIHIIDENCNGAGFSFRNGGFGFHIKTPCTAERYRYRKREHRHHRKHYNRRYDSRYYDYHGKRRRHGYDYYGRPKHNNHRYRYFNRY